MGIVLAANRYKLGSINELGNPFVTSQFLKGRQRVLKTAKYCQSVFPLGHPLFGELSFLGISFDFWGSVSKCKIKTAELHHESSRHSGYWIFWDDFLFFFVLIAVQ